LTGFTHVVYLDEAGKGADFQGLNRLWVAAAVCIPVAHHPVLDASLRGLRASHFHSGVEEVKGSAIPRHLLRKSTSSDVARDLGLLLDAVEAWVWVAAAGHGATAPSSLGPPEGFQAKDIARHLLLGRVSAALGAAGLPADRVLHVWDLTDAQELRDLGRSLRGHHPREADLDDRPAPAVLGGLSNEWSGLQVADVVANFALHRVGFDRNLVDAYAPKAKDFDLYFRHRLQRDPASGALAWDVR
jgi:hypothetical protein